MASVFELARRLTLTVAVSLLVAGCGSDANSVAGQARAGDRKGYVSGDGSVQLIDASKRSDPLVVSGTTLDGAAWSSGQERGHVLVLMNLTPNPLTAYRVGLPVPGHWKEVLNSDAAVYGGGDWGNPAGVTAEDYAVHNQRYSALFTLPPISVSVFRAEG